MAPSLILFAREKCGIPSHQCLLTFDDGPAGVVTEELLGVLGELKVKACFCVVGSEVVVRPEQTRAIVREGHLLIRNAKREEGGIYVLHDGLLSCPVTNLFRGKPDRSWVPSAVKKMVQHLRASEFHFPDPAQALAGRARGD
ncbi:MAG: polysaccharide deacetylase family protein [Verrucomicrobia bacterium]|nr:polysaccharide deacetylase family protein [Verrucomicrobiota bacterium]